MKEAVRAKAQKDIQSLSTFMGDIGRPSTRKAHVGTLKLFTENGIGFVAIGYDLCPSILFKDLNIQVNNENR